MEVELSYFLRRVAPRKYGHSPSKLLKAVYPEHKWDLSKFKTVPFGYWNVKENQKNFMDDLGKQLGFESMQDWYQLTFETLISKQGRGLLEKYGSSPSKLLQSVYPEHPWVEWMFRKVPNKYWDIEENEKRFLDWLGNKLNFQQVDDWKRINKRDIVSNGPYFLSNFLAFFNTSGWVILSYHSSRCPIPCSFPSQSINNL